MLTPCHLGMCSLEHVSLKSPLLLLFFSHSCGTFLFAVTHGTGLAWRTAFSGSVASNSISHQKIRKKKWIHRYLLPPLPQQESPRQEPQLSPFHTQVSGPQTAGKFWNPKEAWKKLWFVFAVIETEWKWQVSSCRLSTKNDTSGSAAGASGIWRD